MVLSCSLVQAFHQSFPASLVPPWCLPGCPISPFLWCRPGCPPWCLPGCPNGLSMALGCLPGKQNQIWPWQITGVSWSCLGRLLESSGRGNLGRSPKPSQAVQMVLSWEESAKARLESVYPGGSQESWNGHEKGREARKSHVECLGGSRETLASWHLPGCPKGLSMALGGLPGEQNQIWPWQIDYWSQLVLPWQIAGVIRSWLP